MHKFFRSFITSISIITFGIILNTFAIECETAFAGIVDNRESNSSVQLPQTIFGALGAAQLGTTLDTTHRFRIGISYLKEFGQRESWKRATFLMYYRYKRPSTLFLIGSFPKRGVLSYPCFLLSDSIGYYRSNIEGAYFEQSFKLGKENIWIDWTSRKTRNNREAFLVGFSGELTFGSLFLSHYFLYYHLAHSKSHPPDEHINDNGGASLRAGNHFTELGLIDSLTFSIDGLMSYDRIRSVTSWHTPVGIQAALRMIIRRFGGSILYYRGMYNDDNNWHRVTWGNAFYTAKEFAQFELYFFPIQSNHVNAKFVLFFNIVENELDARQLFLITMSFDNSLRKKKGRKRE